MKPNSLLALLGFPLLCTASVVVVPNGMDNTPGTVQLGGVINTQFAEMEQVIIGSSQLSSIPIGSAITGIGFRLAPNQPTFPPGNRTFPLFQMLFGEATGEPGTQVALRAANYTFNNHFVITSLTIAANSFTSNATIGQFGFLHFSSPFIYQGGPVLAEWVYSSTGNFEFPLWDGVPVQPGVIAALHNFNANSPEGIIDVFAPVVALEFTPAAVPEPATVWMGFALAGVALLSRRFQEK